MTNLDVVSSIQMAYQVELEVYALLMSIWPGYQFSGTFEQLTQHQIGINRVISLYARWHRN